jgi:hypothetical protein
MKRVMCMILLGAVLAIVIPAARVSAQSSDTDSGTWVLNVAKSKFSTAAPKSETRTYEVSGDSVTQRLDRVDSEGKALHVEVTAKYDGKDYPIKGNPEADTVAITRVDPYKTRATLKKGGKPVVHSERTVAKDGKTMTVKMKGTNSKGEKVDNVLVFDKK